MNTLASIVTTSEIFAIFVLCLGTSFGIAYLFLKTVVNLTTQSNRKDDRCLVSRRSLAALWLRSNHHSGR